jgi:hypothetical protein
MNRCHAAAVLGLFAAPALTACTQSVSAFDVRRPPEPLVAAPVESVQTGALDPAGPPQQLGTGAGAGQNQQVATLQQGAGQQTQLDGQGRPVANQQTAALNPPPKGSGEPVTREAMAGTWTVATDNPDCRIILAFTKWSGGYRAATRRCNAPELTAINAWDVKDNRVVLVDASGNSIASLVGAGPERYQGSTSGGKPIAFTR